jgi:hypothetical protein
MGMCKDLLPDLLDEHLSTILSENNYLKHSRVKKYETSNDSA